MSLNKTMLIGNLARDPETTFLQSGTACTKITVATSESWKDKQTGEKREETEYHRVVFWGKQAEVVGKHFSKGMPIYCEGKNKTSKYTKDGIDRYSTDIIANNFQFIGSKSQNHQPQGQQGGGTNRGNFQAQQGHQQIQGGMDSQQEQGFQQNNSGYQQGPPDDSIPF